jgi:hypothetical protein
MTKTKQLSNTKTKTINKTKNITKTIIKTENKTKIETLCYVRRFSSMRCAGAVLVPCSHRAVAVLAGLGVGTELGSKSSCYTGEPE